MLPGLSVFLTLFDPLPDNFLIPFGMEETLATVEFSMNQTGKKGGSQSINIRRGKLQAETLMDSVRAVQRPLMVGGDGDGGGGCRDADAAAR